MIEFFYRALHSSLGIKVASSDPEKLRQKLYAARRDLKDPDLDGLALVPSRVNPQHLWIVKKNAKKE